MPAAIDGVVSRACLSSIVPCPSVAGHGQGKEAHDFVNEVVITSLFYAANGAVVSPEATLACAGNGLLDRTGATEAWPRSVPP